MGLVSLLTFEMDVYKCRDSVNKIKVIYDGSGYGKPIFLRTARGLLEDWITGSAATGALSELNVVLLLGEPRDIPVSCRSSAIA